MQNIAKNNSKEAPQVLDLSNDQYKILVQQQEKFLLQKINVQVAAEIAIQVNNENFKLAFKLINYYKNTFGFINGAKNKCNRIPKDMMRVSALFFTSNINKIFIESERKFSNIQEKLNTLVFAMTQVLERSDFHVAQVIINL
jgi:hypothetical protein